MSIRRYKVLVPLARADQVRAAIANLSADLPVHIDAVGSPPRVGNSPPRPQVILELSCREDHVLSMVNAVLDAGRTGRPGDVQVTPLDAQPEAREDRA